MTSNLFLFIGTQEIVIIALVALLIFGGKKIPELMRGLGRGVNSFKKGMKEDLEDDIKAESKQENSEKKEE